MTARFDNDVCDETYDRFDNDENAMVDHVVAAEDYARECMSTAAFGDPDRADSTLMGLIETHIGISWNTSLIWDLRVTSADTVVVLCSLLRSN